MSVLSLKKNPVILAELGLVVALSAAAHALADGVLAWREGDLSLDELLAEAATPGGIAATVMATMDRHGHAKIVERSLRAGIVRARKNARQR